MGYRRRESRIFERDQQGHYPEPHWCSERLFDVESFGAPGALILDPACGWGRIPRAAGAAGYTPIASDIADRRGDRLCELAGVGFTVCDFLERSPVSRPWSIASNPPYEHVEEFCERALAIVTYKVAMLVPLRRLPAAHWLERMPLESILLLTPRPSLPPGSWIEAGNTPGGGSQDFCWLVFSAQRSPPIAPRLRWLHRAVKALGEEAVAGPPQPPSG